jgi:hypothetical protein
MRLEHDLFSFICYLACPVAITHRPETTEFDDQIIRSICSTPTSIENSARIKVKVQVPVSGGETPQK